MIYIVLRMPEPVSAGTMGTVLRRTILRSSDLSIG
jgi:hypothetical protein